MYAIRSYYVTFNYLVGLFHAEPVRQGLFGRPLLPGLTANHDDIAFSEALIDHVSATYILSYNFV